jgi:hypothetical protein
MPQKSHLTTSEIAALFDANIWQVRRAVDAIGQSIPRAGLYRLVPRELLGLVKAEMVRRGYLPQEAGATHAH